jgi:hypothetical protein
LGVAERKIGYARNESVDYSILKSFVVALEGNYFGGSQLIAVCRSVAHSQGV